MFSGKGFDRSDKRYPQKWKRRLSLHVSLVKNLIQVCLFVFLSLVLASPCLAEELEPRRWAHLPIDTNFFGSGYAYTEADIGFDPVLKIENVDMEMDTWVAKYIRSFSLFEKTARVSVLQAYQEGRWSGLLDGAPKKIKRSGWTDTRVRFAINLYGAPPLKGKPRTIEAEATPGDERTTSRTFSK